MRVFYGALRSLIVYEQTSVAFCCAEMERQWGKRIGFAREGRSRLHQSGRELVYRPAANKRTDDSGSGADSALPVLRRDNRNGKREVRYPFSFSLASNGG